MSENRANLRLKTMSAILGLITVTSVFSTISQNSASAATPAINLGSAANYTVLTGAAFTEGASNTFSPAGSTVSGQLTGPTKAWIDASSAYNDAAARTYTTQTAAQDIALGTVFGAGTYKFSSYLAATSNFTLDGGGNPDSVFIFQISDYLTTSPNLAIALINGAQSANIFFQVGGYLTTGAGSNLKGTFLINQAVTTGAGTTLDGRVIAIHGAVTTGASNSITIPAPVVVAPVVVAPVVVAPVVVEPVVVAPAPIVVAPVVVAPVVVAPVVVAPAPIVVAPVVVAPAPVVAAPAPIVVAPIVVAPVVVAPAPSTSNSIIVPVQTISGSNAVVTQSISTKSGGKLALAVQGSTGSVMPISISLPAHAFTEDLTLAVTSAMPMIQNRSGFVDIKIVAFTEAKVAITQFDQPIAINLGKVDPLAVLAFSSDDVAWQDIAKLTGDTLPTGSGEGYYIALNGDVVILTRHLTSFGTKVKPLPIEISTKERTLRVGEFFSLNLTGIQGAGHIWFVSSSPSVCGVSTWGIVHPLSAGDCNIQVSVSASGNYMDVHSEPFKFTIEPSVYAAQVSLNTAAPLAITKLPATTKLVGSIYFNRNTSALDRDAYVALAKVLLSLKNSQNYSVKLVGHSDATKGLNNDAISLARSKSVAKFLKLNAISGKIENIGQGTKNLVSTVRANYGMNRRVEVWVTTVNL